MEDILHQLRNNSTVDPDVVDFLQKLLDRQSVLQVNIDNFFLLTCAALVFFMQAGFAFLECGAVRSKNTTNILIKNLLDALIGCAAYWGIGYSFAFGEGNSFIGYQYFFSGLNGKLPDTDYSLWLFHYVFAATAATIVSGSVAERCEFAAYFIYSFVITGFVYPVVTHWAWSSGGWLAQGIRNGDVTFADFAGSAVVHLLGGISALVGAAMLGPRLGRFREDGTPQSLKGHSVPLTALGGFILLLGFLAFNGGSQASMSQPGDGEAVSLAMVNTMIGCSFAAFTGLFFNRIMGSGQWSFLITMNAALTGMVSMCAGCNVYYPWAAAVVGTIAGLAYVCWSLFVLYVLRVDDALDAIAVHAGGGFWGVLAVPIFRFDGGIVYTGSKLAFLGFAWNLVGAVAIAAWSSAVCLIMFGALRFANLLRVNRDVEMRGLDIVKHGEPAYPIDPLENELPALNQTATTMLAKSILLIGGAPFQPSSSSTDLTVTNKVRQRKAVEVNHAYVKDEEANFDAQRMRALDDITRF